MLNIFFITKCYICPSCDSLIAKILHITLGFFLLFGSTGFTVKKHFCQQELESISFLPTNSCCKSKSHSACKKAISGCEKDCCKSELAYFHSDQVQEIQEVEILSLKKRSLVLSSIFCTWNSLVAENFQLHRSYLTYKPPIVQRNLSTLFQVFRL